MELVSLRYSVLVGSPCRDVAHALRYEEVVMLRVVVPNCGRGSYLNRMSSSLVRGKLRSPTVCRKLHFDMETPL